ESARRTTTRGTSATRPTDVQTRRPVRVCRQATPSPARQRLGARSARRAHCPPVVPRTNPLWEEIPMTTRSWFRSLLARPATRPTPARCHPTRQALEDRAPPTGTFKPAGGTAKPHPGCCAAEEQARRSLVHPDRFSPVTVGLWLGGAGLGTGGCLLGA